MNLSPFSVLKIFAYFTIFFSFWKIEIVHDRNIISSIRPTCSAMTILLMSKRAEEDAVNWWSIVNRSALCKNCYKIVQIAATQKGLFPDPVPRSLGGAATVNYLLWYCRRTYAGECTLGCWRAAITTCRRKVVFNFKQD